MYTEDFHHHEIGTEQFKENCNDSKWLDDCVRKKNVMGLDIKV